MIDGALTDEEQEIIRTIERFVDERVRQQVQMLEKAGQYPEKLVSMMKELGLFGMAVP